MNNSKQDLWHHNRLYLVVKYMLCDVISGKTTLCGMLSYKIVYI
jgi:hypothetical protein